MNEQDEWPYWKAAISCLPTQEMRDAAWEFFVRHLAQNPKMADTFSGVILVMQANGLYMLKVPKLVHDEALVPLGREVSRLRDEMAETLSRHAEVTRDTFAVCEKTRQVAEAAAKAAKELDNAIRHGWRDFVREKLNRSLSESRLSDSCKDALREWQTILSCLPLNEVLDLITQDSDEGQRLRHSTPFSGILSQRERMDVFRRHEATGA